MPYNRKVPLLSYSLHVVSLTNVGMDEFLVLYSHSMMSQSEGRKDLSSANTLSCW